MLKEAEQLPQPQRDRLEIAHRNGIRLLKLVNSLLDFSRIEAGRMRASYAPVDLASFTADLASNFRSAMEAGGLKLVVDSRPLSAPVYVDRDMWEKVVLNLLSNAFKFTLQGSVRVRLEENGGRAILIVADTGVGIPESELTHIFERFYRAESVRGRTYEGTGIGLALIQELIKLHGGTIEAKSQVGEGSVFTVTLPFGSSHLPPERIAAGASTAVHAQAFTEEALTWTQERLINPSADDTPPASPDASQSSQRSLVLVADDNSDMREHLSRILGSQYEVVTATNGRAALQQARRTRPDLILSDVMMPELDGFGLVRDLRADADLREVPVILLSARAGEEARIEGVSAGADDYLVKPFSAGELLARTATHLKLAHLRQDTLSAMSRLQEVSTRIIGESDLPKLLGEVLDAAIEITGADMGNVQLLDASTGDLKIVAHRGFERPFLDYFNTVHSGRAACGTAMQQGCRIVVEDVASSPIYDSKTREVMLGAEARAVQATPFIMRSGKLLGMFSTHYRSPRRPAALAIFNWSTCWPARPPI